MKKKSSDSGYDIVWEPETLKEYMEVAEADVRFDELFALFPDLVNVQVYARQALEEGVSLIKSFRRPEAALCEARSGDFTQDDGLFVFWSARHEWVLGLCYLWIYISRILSSLDNDPCAEHWPRRPGIEGLGEVGRAALEVVELFALSVGDIAFDALKSAYAREDYNGLVYDFVERDIVVLEPRFEPRALRWLEGLRDSLAKAYPVSRWPDVLLDRDHRRLAVVLSCEEDEALKAYQDANTRGCTQPTGVQLLRALGKRDAFMSCADLAAIFDVEPESLRKRLERFREKHAFDPDIYVEAQDRSLRKAKYLYNARIADTIARHLRKRTASVERPPKENDL